MLQVGDVTESVSVVGEVAQVQTNSSEHSASLTTSQVQGLTARGRDVVSMLRTMPGVQYQADQDSVGGSYGTSTPNIGGASANTNILAVDGVVSNDQGTPSVFSSVTTLDAIGEVKVLLNSYPAEYAGNGGAVVQVVTRSGGKEFHGGGYYYVRNDALNANDFFNNRNGVRRPRYRYNTLGATVGALNQYTMPTALERQGDFSQTLDVNGKLKEGRRGACQTWVRTLNISCAHGSGRACFTLGLALDDGTVIARDLPEGAKDLGRACDLRAGRVSEPGRAGAPQRPQCVGRACGEGDGESCFLLASLYYAGGGVPKDFAKAAELFRRSCDGGWARGCGGLAECYKAGQGTAADPEQAIHYFERACKGGIAASCYAAAGIYRGRKGDTLAALRLRQACELSTRATTANTAYFRAASTSEARLPPAFCAPAAP